ncbi:hypothetical protein CEXT_763241 [Caerostris extrusa]|uniref:Uncharacterized protein n=1 Tax=Caerostris extrusa TaxID=172846 RepID=A0AAV4MS98_CAEEX|nr:hypothetical protein CEXT_763241 [Caerostris extrusa]
MPQLQIIDDISPSVMINPVPSNQLNCGKPNLSKIPKPAHACDTENQKHLIHEHEESSLKDQLNIFTALFNLFNTEDSESNPKLQFLNDISSPVRNSPLPSNQLDCVKKKM